MNVHSPPGFPAVLGVDSDTVLQDDKISHIRVILPKGGSSLSLFTVIFAID